MPDTFRHKQTGQDTMTLAMSWREWAAQDAVGLAQLVRQRHVTPAELAQQAAAGIAATNPTLHGVIE
ncbi:MAG: hypothetical protein EB096_06745, partial [Betaproteobacteria bacterium]|nr:hypothetical protein [Betaproteobacteria bacterium]